MNRKVLLIVVTITLVSAIVILINQLYSPKRSYSEAEQYYSEILGCWSMGIVDTSGYSIGSLRLIDLDEDASLRVAIHLETSSLGFINVDDYNIKYEEGHLEFWGDMYGYISEDKKTVPLIYTDINGDTIHFKMQKIFDADTIAFLRRLRAAKSVEYAYSKPEETQDGLNPVHANDVGIDTTKISALCQRIFHGDYDDIHSLIILKHGNITVEEYFGASGKLHGPAVSSALQSAPHDLASVSKSVQSAFIGIAIDSGLIRSVETPLAELIPEYARLLKGQKSNIRLKHLLAMNAGLEWNELDVPVDSPGNDNQRMGRAADQLRFAINKPVASAPGEELIYSTGNFILLREILLRVTKQSLRDYSAKVLFNALGIYNYLWPDNNAPALCPRDMAIIGQLYLQKGQWMGKQLISKQWIEESTKNHQNTTESRYGYQWWLRNFRVADKVIKSYYAIGLGGNFISVFPALDLVVVCTARNYSTDWSRNFYRMLENYILPAQFELSSKQAINR